MLKEGFIKTQGWWKEAEKLAFTPLLERLLGKGSGRNREVFDPGSNWAENDNDPRHISFTFAVIALAAKLSKIDGEPNEQEFQAFRALFPMQDNQSDKIRRLFEMACDDRSRFERYASQIANLFPHNTNLLTELLDRLFKIAAADNALHTSEIEFLRKTATILGISATEFQRKLGLYIPSKPPNMYAILGVSPRISDEELKQVYRKLIYQYHPDGLMAMGASPEEVARASRKLASINHAYDRIIRKRGIK